MDKLGVIIKPEFIYNADEKLCSSCFHKHHQLYKCLKETLTGNITRSPWSYYLQGCW